MSIYFTERLSVNVGGGASGKLIPLLASYWVTVAATNFPKRRGMTSWRDGTQAPDKIGLYQRYYTDGLYFDYWDGTQWLSRDKDGAPHWRQVGDYVAWRGLTEKGWLKAKSKEHQ